MSLKDYFKGKSGAWFWTNLVLMISAIVAVPVVTLHMLDVFTRHGEKIEVPSVVGKPQRDAELMMKDRGLVAVVADSTYDKRMRPGAVLDQSPKPGYEVKSGRVVYLTVNLTGEPMTELPDVVSHGSLREAVAMLTSLGFRLSPHEKVMGRPKDLVLGVKQGGRELFAGQNVPRDRVLTIVIGGGEIDSVEVDTTYYDGDVNVTDDGDGNDFDIEL